MFAVFDLDCEMGVEIYPFLEGICVLVAWLFDIDCDIQKNWWDFLIEGHDLEIIRITDMVWKMGKFGQEVWEGHVVGLSQGLEFAFGYFRTIDDDIGGAKFGEQFVGCNPLPLVWVGQMGKEGLHPWTGPILGRFPSSDPRSWWTV